MKTGICPKCQSSEVYFNETIIPQEGSNLRITAFSFAALEYYVCVDCGFVESYISNPNKLHKINEKWVKVKN